MPRRMSENMKSCRLPGALTPRGGSPCEKVDWALFGHSPPGFELEDSAVEVACCSLRELIALVVERSRAYRETNHYSASLQEKA